MIFFKKKPVANPIAVDLHSHLLPGLDDGVKNMEESLQILTEFQKSGIKKIITTPHIIGDFYPNTPEIIRAKLEELRDALKVSRIDIEIQAAAEYYIDDQFIGLLQNKDELLSFGDKFVLVEIPFMNEPRNLQEVFFKMKSSGYKVVLAHPERYLYYHQNLDKLREFTQQNIYLQLNATSLEGYYSPEVKKQAERLLKERLITFIGSDCHNMKQFSSYKKALSNKYLTDAMSGIQNNSL